jgi:hypothetical protein
LPAQKAALANPPQPLGAHGAGSLPRPIPAVVITTDPEDTLAEGERRYVVVDGRSPELLANQLHRLLSIERLLVFVDGVANRADVDRVLADIADLVLVRLGPRPKTARVRRRTSRRCRRRWPFPTAGRPIPAWPSGPGNG